MRTQLGTHMSECPLIHNHLYSQYGNTLVVPTSGRYAQTQTRENHLTYLGYRDIAFGPETNGR